MTLSITLAKSEADYIDVARFWYQIYCVLRGVLRDQADHTAQELRDPLMRVGDLFVARRDGAVAGTVLSTYAKNNPLEDYADFYELERLSEYPATVAISTKFMVAPAYRNGSLPIRLLQATTSKGLRDGISHTVYDCNPPLDKLFTNIGGKDHAGVKSHPVFGDVHVMLLALRDDAKLICANPHNPLARCYAVLEKETVHV